MSDPVTLSFFHTVFVVQILMNGPLTMADFMRTVRLSPVRIFVHPSNTSSCPGTTPPPARLLHAAGSVWSQR